MVHAPLTMNELRAGLRNARQMWAKLASVQRLGQRVGAAAISVSGLKAVVVSQ